MTKHETPPSSGTQDHRWRFRHYLLDGPLRPAKDRLLAPLTHGPLAAVPPLAHSMLALAAAIGAAFAKWQQLALVAVALWLLSRLADGLDGPVASVQGTASDRGGLVDIVFDTIGYALMSIDRVDEDIGGIDPATLVVGLVIFVVSLALARLLLRRQPAQTQSPTTNSTIEGSTS